MAPATAPKQPADQKFEAKLREANDEWSSRSSGRLQRFSSTCCRHRGEIIREEGFQGRAGGRPCTLLTLCKIHRVYDHDCDACKQAIAGAVLPRSVLIRKATPPPSVPF